MARPFAGWFQVERPRASWTYVPGAGHVLGPDPPLVVTVIVVVPPLGQPVIPPTGVEPAPPDQSLHDADEASRRASGLAAAR
jgi:hypothetical protein